VLGEDLMRRKQLTGWVNVPADCVRPLSRIHLHPARPAGVNEPTEAGVRGAEEILRLVSSLEAADLCLCLLSGGGSALLPAPCEGISLDDKLAVTRHLSAAGADIRQLNTVRKQLSRIKGGGLTRACKAGRLVALIISDVLGDPLDLIASGPTVADPGTPHDALEVLQRFGARQAGVSERVFELLERKARAATADPAITCRVDNLVIGNNATAVEAAGREAQRLGYTVALEAAAAPEGQVEPIGRRLAETARSMRSQASPNCLVSGGEGVVRLVDPQQRGKGGRNQQTVLAAAEHFWQATCQGICLLSAGTDGEDGPTDAAGAILNAPILEQARALGLHPTGFLQRNDAYRFFEPLGALIKTGPTHTNVCDLRVVVVDRP
jgi:glycerate 2-kinase